MQDDGYMELCLLEAEAARSRNEVPVGAVIVDASGTVIARAHNMTRSLNNPTAHAEVMAIEEASRKIGNFRLTGYTLFVSKEPCIMCAGAIVEARIGRLVFGCQDTRRGAFGSAMDVNTFPLNHRVEVCGGVLKDRSERLLKQFFQARRGTEVAITGPTRNRLYA